MGLKQASFFFVLVASLALIYSLLDLPDKEGLTVIVTDWFARYGLGIILIGSMIEAMLFVGIYFPGSLIIFIGVGTSLSPEDAVMRVMMVNIGMILGYTFNYVLGRYGWYRVFLKLGMKEGIESAQQKLQANDARYIFLTFWNVGLAAFVSTAAGILHIPFQRFILLVIGSLAVWNTLWGILVYNLGEKALSLLGFKVVLIMIAIWIAFELCLLAYKRFASS